MTNLVYPFKMFKPRSPRPGREYTISLAPAKEGLHDQAYQSWIGDHGAACTLLYSTTYVERAIASGQWVVIPEGQTVISMAAAVAEGEAKVVTDPASTFNTYDSLPTLKEAWKATIHADGGDCPVCSRFGKVYDRTINETMAQGLKWLYDMAVASGDPRAWINCPLSMPKEFLRSNQHTTLRWWGLVERMLPDEKEKTKKFSGLWRITLKGMDFVEGKIAIPDRVFTYNGEPVSHGKELTLFKDCKGGFDYAATMAGTAHAVGRSLFPANDEHSKAA